MFSAAVDGRVYARHGTNVETRLTVIDRVPADDPAAFPTSPGMAGDPATLLAWVTALVPPRSPIVAPVLASQICTVPSAWLVVICAPSSLKLAEEMGLELA